jgi:hypothetical protein
MTSLEPSLPCRSHLVGTKCKGFIYIYFLYISVQSEDIHGLTVTPEHVNVDVGAHPTFTCSVKYIPSLQK